MSTRTMLPVASAAALALVLAATPGTAHAEDAATATATVAEPDVAVHETDKSHAVFARTDVGSEG